MELFLERLNWDVPTPHGIALPPPTLLKTTKTTNSSRVPSNLFRLKELSTERYARLQATVQKTDKLDFALYRAMQRLEREQQHCFTRLERDQRRPGTSEYRDRRSAALSGVASRETRL